MFGVGNGFTVITPVVLAEQLPTVAIKVYVPFASMLTALMLGFCELLLKALGPDHEYTAPPLPFRLSVVPKHGVLLTIAGTGKG